jgi:hypothetical protein
MTPSPTATRVQEHTAEHINRRINRITAGNFARHAHSSPEQIEQRLAELDREWDIERTLQTNFAAVTLTGIVFGMLFGRRWWVLSAAATGYMLQHAIEGWCPPIPIFRRLGFRTAREIDHERHALKALRGEYNNKSHARTGPGERMGE